MNQAIHKINAPGDKYCDTPAGITCIVCGKTLTNKDMARFRDAQGRCRMIGHSDDEILIACDDPYHKQTPPPQTPYDENEFAQAFLRVLREKEENHDE